MGDFWYEVPFKIQYKILQEVYLFGLFVGGWVKRRRGGIVAVVIVIMTMFVLLSGGRGQQYIRVDMCW